MRRTLRAAALCAVAAALVAAAPAGAQLPIPTVVPTAVPSGASTPSAQRPVGDAAQPLIHRINRPTYQQVTEIQHTAPR